MTDIDHERWSENVPAYLLGALEPEEAAALERHAAGCERCQTDMRWLMPAVQALPEAVKRVEPPQELRARLMAEALADAEAAPQGDPVEARGRLGGWLRGSGSGPVALRPALGLAALALVVAAVVGYAIGGGSGGEGTKTSTFVAGHSPGITAKLVREGDSGTLHLANVQKLPPAKVLEAWIQRDGALIPDRALFAPDSNGHASTTVQNMGGAEAVLVTAEPRGGSDQPTAEPIVSIPVQ